MPLASLLCMEGAAGAQEILAAMTLRPARALKLSGKRGIRKGADADMIVFQARDLEELFCSFGRQAPASASFIRECTSIRMSSSETAVFFIRDFFEDRQISPFPSYSMKEEEGLTCSYMKRSTVR